MLAKSPQEITVESPAARFERHRNNVLRRIAARDALVQDSLRQKQIRMAIVRTFIRRKKLIAANT